MALLRTEQKGAGCVMNYRRGDGSLGTKVVGIYDGIIEKTADLSLSRLIEFAPGSMLYCMENRELYIKNSDEEWEAVSE